MSFPRQWFPPQFKVGLQQNSVRFFDALKKKDFKACESIASTSINHRDEAQYWHRQLKRLNRIKKRSIYNKIVLISFIDFWPDFNPASNQILDFFKSSRPDLNFQATHDTKKCDIAIYSCYGNNETTFAETAAADRWIFLGENVRPEFYNFDYSLSFDVDSYHGRNIHLPLWLLEIDLFGKSYQDRSPASLKNFTLPNAWDYAQRKDAAIFVGNNAEPLRESIITHLINNNIKVDRFGSQSNPIDDKIEKYKEYKLVISMENSCTPGYVTEKLMHAYLSGCHIIYHGDTRATPQLLLDNPQIFHYKPSSARSYSDLYEFAIRAFQCNHSISSKPLLNTLDICSLFGKVLASINSSTAHLSQL